jgi:5-methylthioadenosine/S-adenosylhomocysteine deaminase
MCIYCGSGLEPGLGESRRDFMKSAMLVGAAAAASGLMAGGAHAQDAPAGTGTEGRRVLIRGGHVLSMDPAVGDFAEADILVNGRLIEAVGPNLAADGAEVIDASGMIVMPGFIDTHHHQFETALRSFLADGILVNDGVPANAINYYDHTSCRSSPWSTGPRTSTSTSCSARSRSSTPASRP